MIVYTKIKESREHKRISQAKMAESLNIATQNYWKIENGKTELTVSRLYQIAEILNVPVSELLGISVSNTDNSKTDRIKELEDSLSSARERLEATIKANSHLTEMLTANSNKLSSKEAQLQDLVEFQHTIPILGQALFQQIEREYGVDLWAYKVKDTESLKKEPWFNKTIKNNRLLLILLIGSSLLTTLDSLLIDSLYKAMSPYNGLEQILLNRYEAMKSLEAAMMNYRPDKTDYFNLE